MLLCITFRDTLPVISPILAFFLGLWAAGILDRRRALYAVRGRIQAAIDDIRSEKGDFNTAHQCIIKALKEPVFGALPLLNKQQQDRVLKVWANFRQIRLHDFTAPGGQLSIFKRPGAVKSVKTQKEALLESLSALDDALG